MQDHGRVLDHANAVAPSTATSSCGIFFHYVLQLAAMRSIGRSSLDSWSLRGVATRLAAGIAAGDELPGAGRRYRRVDVGALAAHVDAWLIAWPPGTGLPLHDHDGSCAVVHVVRSALRERYVVEETIAERHLRAGDHVHLPPEHLHEITNVTDDEALSLHVYSPRLTLVRFRSEFGGLVRASVGSDHIVEADFVS